MVHPLLQSPHENTLWPIVYWATCMSFQDPSETYTLNRVNILQVDKLISRDQKEALRGQLKVFYILLGTSHNEDENLDLYPKV